MTQCQMVLVQLSQTNFPWTSTIYYCFLWIKHLNCFKGNKFLERESVIVSSEVSIDPDCDE